MTFLAQVICMKRMAAFLLVWVFLAVPFVMGATPVTTATQNSDQTYTPTADNNLGIIQGGHIYNYTLNVEEQTKYWAGIYGTISQTVVLKDAAGNAFYTWTPASISYTAVFLSEEQNVDFATGTFVGDIVDQNVVNAGIWSAAPAVEGVDNTFTVAATTECDFTGITLASGSWKYVDTTDGTTAYWRTCIAGWDADGNGINTAADGILIAGQVDAAGHTAYDGTTTANYQVLVPAPDTGIAYYVWVA